MEQIGSQADGNAHRPAAACRAQCHPARLSQRPPELMDASISRRPSTAALRNKVLGGEVQYLACDASGRFLADPPER
ncbi:MAG: hypothetical protein ACLR4Z_03570 [Butyricicoccaceae bacterium]